MKQVLFALVAISLLIVGCQPENDEVTPDTQECSSLTISLESATRTSLAANNDEGLYPICWNMGDEVVVNGVLSDKVTADEHNKPTANFAFSEGSISAPYSVTYPYCSLTSAEKTYVEYPAVQNFVSGGVIASGMPMCGYAENSNEITLKITNH